MLDVCMFEADTFILHSSDRKKKFVENVIVLFFEKKKRFTSTDQR